jgi:thiamine-phosphate pyrophosphorylase
MTDLRKGLRLYVIPDPRIGRGKDLLDQARLALAGGATALQLRLKEAPSRDFYDAACRMGELCRRAGALFFVNDRLDIALASGADGVHLGQSDLPCAQARRLAPEGFLIGVSAHTPDQARQAAADGADYLGVGAVFPTGSKSDAAPCGLEGLRSVRAAVELPLVAIGGITLEGIPPVLHAGADGVAVISAVVGQKDPQDAARRFQKALS